MLEGPFLHQQLLTSDRLVKGLSPWIQWLGLIQSIIFLLHTCTISEALLWNRRVPLDSLLIVARKAEV